MAEGPDPGCQHYKRKIKFVAPCCNKIYTCRFCHDENESHEINRKDVQEIICVSCDTRQKVHEECEECHERLGLYICLICRLFDDEDKKQYHCDGCGICRVGGQNKFFHCERCNMCLPVKLLNNHKCIENVSRANCPVCMKDMHTSRTACYIPPICGHLLHRPCFDKLVQEGCYTCPICRISMLDMQKFWKELDIEIQLTPMPSEYDYNVDILCSDCHQTSNVKFHVVALKCSHCGSYNTLRT